MSYRPPQLDRRSGRSSDTFVSLCRLLDAMRRDRGLRALAVADNAGCLVAGSGASQVCEELAAVSTLPANDPILDELGFGAGRRRVRQLLIDGVEVSISVLGEADDSDYSRLSDGCRRILTEAVGRSAAR